MRILVSSGLAILSVVCLAINPAAATTIHGQAVTCPPDGNSQPLVGASVRLTSEGGQNLGSYTTDENGFWSLEFNGPDQFITASFGAPVQNYHCSAGCCRQVTVYVSGMDVNFPDVQLKCGGPKDPPCPSQ